MSYRISRKIINEMVKREQNISSRRSSGGSGAGGGGGVSSAWVDEHYVSKDFFARLFTIHSDVVTEEDPHGEVVEPNDLETDIDNIEMMFGSWTEHYLSALGQGSGGGGGGSILTEPLATINESGLGTPPQNEERVIAWTGSAWAYRPYSTVLQGSRWWGQQMNSSGVVSGTITVGNGDIVMNNNKYVYFYDNPSGADAAQKEVLRLSSQNNLLIGYGTATAGYTTRLYGNEISFRYGTSGSTGMTLNSSGNFGIGTTSPNYKLDVNGDVHTSGDIVLDNAQNIMVTNKPGDGETAVTMEVLRLTSGNNLYLCRDTGTAGYSTTLYGSPINFRYGTSGTLGMALRSTGHLTINASDDTDATRNIYLNVGGNVKATKFYFTNSVYLEYDSSNSGVHLVGAGLYADTYISALGAGSGGGGGSTTLTEPLASINEAGMGSPSGTNKVIVYTSSGWSYMPYTTGGSGSVTSVGLSMPTGFTVTGTPVTGSGGTLTVAFGGSVSKNRVLAAPSDAAGAPSWRKLVAADIPDLSGTYATDARMDTVEGYFTEGVANNAARLSTVSKTAWGQTYWTANGVPDSISGNMSNVGNIAFSASGKNIGGLMYFNTTDSQIKLSSNADVVTYSTNGTNTITPKLYVTGSFNLSGDIVLRNAQDIRLINSPASGETAVAMESMRLSSGNAMYLCRGTGQAGYTTYFYGNNIYFRYGTSGTNGMILNSAGNFGIGITSPSYKLHVNGYTKTSRLYLSDSVYLEYDSSNSGVHLVGAGLYADTYVSALGAGSGGGSGSGITMADVWDALAATAPSVLSQQIDITHLISVSTYYATKTWANSNFVTLTGAQTITGEKTFSADIKPSGYGYNLGASDKRWSNVYCNYCNTQYNATVGGTLTVNGTINSLSITTETPSIASAVSSTKVSSQSSKALWCYSGTLLYASGSWISTSDVRKKDIMEHVEASVEQIAKTSVFNYRMKDDKSGNISLGTSAQEWQKIFPTTVKTMPDGFLGFDYASAALGASVMAAREIVRLKKKVAELEKQLKAS